jgi:hypothetical protein
MAELLEPGQSYDLLCLFSFRRQECFGVAFVALHDDNIYNIYSTVLLSGQFDFFLVAGRKRDECNLGRSQSTSSFSDLILAQTYARGDKIRYMQFYQSRRTSTNVRMLHVDRKYNGWRAPQTYRYYYYSYIGCPNNNTWPGQHYQSTKFSMQSLSTAQTG